MTEFIIDKQSRIAQGDIFRDVEFIEYISEKGGIIEVSRIIFPYIIVLTQDCDLSQDHQYRYDINKSDDKIILSVIVAPLYNVEHVFEGDHLSQLGFRMDSINKKRTPGKDLIKNSKSRYHYLNLPDNIPIPNSVIDFKHYFTVNVKYLLELRENWICKVKELYREQISQRFAYYLSRIGLPEPKVIKK